MFNTKTIVRLYQTVKPHQPAIRFRYGTHETKFDHTFENNYEGASVLQPKSKSETTTSTTTTGAVSILESSQLPTRFQRVALDEAEINAINSGGAE